VRRNGDERRIWALRESRSSQVSARNSGKWGFNELEVRTDNKRLDRIGKRKMIGSAQSNSCQAMIPKNRLFAAAIVGYLFGYAQPTNTRSLALVGDLDLVGLFLVFVFVAIRAV